MPDKFMMKVAALMIKNKKNKTPFEIEFENAIKASYDISSPEYIKPLISIL